MTLRSPAGAVLVLGATGILAPAVDYVRARGLDVIGVSRRGGKDCLACDAQDTVALASALGDAHLDSAIVYGPTVSPQSLAWLEQLGLSRLVLITTSSAADPAHGPFRLGPNQLQLGWKPGPPAAWHSPAEVSAAAVQVWETGQSHILGVIRPWEAKP